MSGCPDGKAVREMIEARNIKFNPEVELVYVPPHQGPKVVRDSNIGNEMGWLPVDGKSPKTKYENVFAIGDVAAISLVSAKPLPPAGVFAHFEADVVVANIVSEIKGIPADNEFDGHAFCFLELEYGKAGLASVRVANP